MRLDRRRFFKVCSAGMAGSSIATLGFFPTATLAEVRAYKVARSRETRSTCPYCSVGCGMLMYSKTDGAGNVKDNVFHIEGDPDHPVSRGALCPKGAGAVDFINSRWRLRYPMVREKYSKEWKRISWDEALERIARHIKNDRDKNFIEQKGNTPVNRYNTTGMLACTSTSNEAGFLTQKMILGLGMVATDHVARICHAPSVTGLAPSFGRGAMTNHQVDIKNTDLIVVMGGNPAEAHPVGFRWAIEARNKNNAKLLVIDPRFNRTAAVADKHIFIRPGTDIAFLNGVINYLMQNNKYHEEYVHEYTNATFIVSGQYEFKDGLFGALDADNEYDRSNWNYQLDADGYAKRDFTMKDPHCVWNILKEHVSRYTPDVVSNVCGTPQEDFLIACQMMAETCVPEKVMTSLYALGWTEHTVGSQNIRAMGIVQLLLGNMGRPGGGINALRGHSNVQGLTDLGVLYGTLPGYLTLPYESQNNLQNYLEVKTPKALAQGQVNYWANYPKFFVSQLKTFYADKATAENNFGYDWLPKWDQAYDTMKYIDMMEGGQVNGYIIQGYNLMASLSNTNKTVRALSQLDFLVVIDPIDAETANFWQNFGEYNEVDPESIKTEVFNLPSSLFAEEEGSLTNTSRWVQWHWAASEPPGEGKTDSAIVAEIFLKIRELYEQQLKDYQNKVPGVSQPVGMDSLMNLSWNYSQPLHPSAEEVAKEMNGKAVTDLKDENGNIILKKGQLLSSFAQMRDDGSTSAGCWIYTGCWTEAGNMMARRDTADPSGLGNTLGWAWAWPANRRILYNRASLNRQGVPWDKTKQLIHWNGSAWQGFDVPDFPNIPPGSPANPFIMQTDGAGGLFCTNKLKDGPLPEHYEPMESPIAKNPLHPEVGHSPTVRVLERDKDSFGSYEEFPYVATSYRLTEHFHTLTQNAQLNAIVQPESFAEISETLAEKIGVKAGDMIRVSSKRGHIETKAVVTKRIKQLNVDKEQVEVVGLPFAWGFLGEVRKSYLINRLTATVGDANTQTPEFKAFLVKVEKV